MARDFVTGLLPDGPAPSDQEPPACDPSRGPAPGDLNYRSEWEASREISHEEAREIARRLIASHFRRTDCETARVGIPARPDYDDDLLICSYIKQQSRKDAERAGADPLVAYLLRQWTWSKETFGPDLRTKGIVQHITKELREIEAEPHDLAEWVDVIILAMDGFWRHGGKPEDLLPVMQAKQDKNFARKWPDWRAMGEDQAIEHDRSGEPAQAIEARRAETQSGSACESAVGESRGAHE